MKTTKHWLHILLAILTGGLWLPMYVIVVATTEMYNRGYRVGKAVGRVEKSNEYEAERMQPKMVWGQVPDSRTQFNCRSVATPIVPFDAPDSMLYDQTRDTPSEAIVRTQSRVDRFAELCDRVRTVGLDQYERVEYNRLKAELSR